MIYSAKDIARWGSCPEGVEFAEKYAPNGFTIMEFLALEPAPNQYIHWVFERITPTEEEYAAYLNRMQINNTQNFYYVDHTDNCSFVVKSSHIKDCSHVFDSKQIVNSKDIVDCEDVVNSSMIFLGTFIENSTKVNRGSNITDSFNIYNSTMILNSKNVFESNNIVNSNEIVKSENVTNSYFCRKCKNIRNCLFCDCIEGKEYYIFNQPVTKEQFELLLRQYLKYQTAELAFIDNWPEDVLMNFLPKATINYSKWYEPIPEKFWKWARTLPNFDPMALYEMTMLPEILVD